MPKSTTPSPRPAASSGPTGHKRSATTTGAPAPGPLTLAALDDGGDAIRGLQLEMQWEAAIKGEAEQHIFGAMMILLVEHLRLSTLGQAKNLSNEERKGKGLEGWLAEHAPKVKRPTALRWMKAAQGLLHKSGLGDAAALQHLLGTPADDLPEPERARQLELFTTLEKHSQADLLEAAPGGPRGGNQHPKCPHCDGNLKSKTQPYCPHCKQSTLQKTLLPEEERQKLVDSVRDWAGSHLLDSKIRDKLWRLLPDHEAPAWLAHLDHLHREAVIWFKRNKAEREAVLLEEIFS